MKSRTNITLLLLLLATSLCAGEYFPYRTKKISIEFSKPFKNTDGAPKLADIKLELEVSRNRQHKSLYTVKSAKVLLNEKILIIPAKFLKHIGDIKIMESDIHWMGEKTYWDIYGQDNKIFRIEIQKGKIIDYKEGSGSDFWNTKSIKQKF